MGERRMCQGAVRRLCNFSERCLVQKVARLLAQTVRTVPTPSVLLCWPPYVALYFRSPVEIERRLCLHLRSTGGARLRWNGSTPPYSTRVRRKSNPETSQPNTRSLPSPPTMFLSPPKGRSSSPPNTLSLPAPSSRLSRPP